MIRLPQNRPKMVRPFGNLPATALRSRRRGPDLPGGGRPAPAPHAPRFAF
jgi:hypothetical protein